MGLAIGGDDLLLVLQSIFLCGVLPVVAQHGEAIPWQSCERPIRLPRPRGQSAEPAAAADEDQRPHELVPGLRSASLTWLATGQRRPGCEGGRARWRRACGQRAKGAVVRSSKRKSSSSGAGPATRRDRPACPRLGESQRLGNVIGARPGEKPRILPPHHAKQRIGRGAGSGRGRGQLRGQRAALSILDRGASPAPAPPADLPAPQILHRLLGDGDGPVGVLGDGIRSVTSAERPRPHLRRAPRRRRESARRACRRRSPREAFTRATFRKHAVHLELRVGVHHENLPVGDGRICEPPPRANFVAGSVLRLFQRVARVWASKA